MDERTKQRSAAPAARRLRAVESFQSAAECIGTIEPGCAVFAITRGQFSMIDAVLAVLDQTGPASVSLWTWTVAEYEVEVLARLRRDERIRAGLLVIDCGALVKNAGIVADWRGSFGDRSVRYVVNHAKIATVESDRFRVLLRGSMNLNFNPRFEQFDLTEGGADFDLIREVEGELPFFDDVTGEAAYSASRVSAAFEPEQLAMFSGVRRWAR